MMDEIKIISDDRAIAAQAQMAAASASNVSTYAASAQAMARLAAAGEADRSDEAIYREACRARMGLANKVYADLPAVLKYAEAYLAAIRARFQREAEPVSPVSTGPAVG